MILVDTSVWIDFLTRRARSPKAETKITDFATCPPVVQEILQGFTDQSSYMSFEDRLLAFPCLSEPVPLELYVKAAAIYREGRHKGYTIRSAVDCLVAAIAIEHGVPVWHRDRDFAAIARYTPLRAVARYLS
jgi:predicted nucleic acid-binding protein